LDPLADKIFCNTALWSIYFLKYCSISMLLVALFLTLRDLALLFGSLLVISKQTTGKDLKPIFMSKVCTALIFSLCCLAVIDIGMKGVILEILSLLCLFGIIITSCIYTVRFFK
jgi:phosphatidylglycerophosphate synthase